MSSSNNHQPLARRRECSIIQANRAGNKMEMMIWPDGVWQDEKGVKYCTNKRCNAEFSLTVHRHHCRYCGNVFCDKCAPELPLVNGTPLLKQKRTKARRCNSCKLPIIMRAYRHKLDGPLTARPIEIILSYLNHKSITSLIQSCNAMQRVFHVRNVPYFEQIYNRFPTAFTGAQVGKGACGTVLMVEDRMRNDMKVALKLVPKHTIYSYTTWSRLYDEMSIMDGNTHANVCQMLEVIQTHDTLIIVMECGEGGTLKNAYDVIKKRRYDMEVFTAHVASQVSAGLDYLYQQRSIVHRDLKVENIVLSKDFSRVMIIDFGLAAIIKDRTAPQRYVACGTPGYASPENITPVVVKRSTYFEALGDAMHAADMFSMGVILFMLLSNSKPISGKKFNDMYKEMQAGLRCQGPKWTNVSQGAKTCVEGCLITKHAQRWMPHDVLQCDWIQQKAPQFHRIADELLKEWENQDQKILDEFDVVEAPEDDGFQIIDEDEYLDTFPGSRNALMATGTQSPV